MIEPQRTKATITSHAGPLWRRAWPLVALAAAATGAFLFASLGTHEGSANAGLAVENACLNFGEVWEKEEFPWNLRLTNNGSTKLEVVGFSATCSCISSVEPETFTLESGETRDIALTLDLTRRTGTAASTWKRSFEVTVIPHVKGASARLGGWRLSGNVKVPLLLSPNSIDFGGGSLIYGQSAEPEQVRIRAQAGVERVVHEWKSVEGSTSLARVEVTKLPGSKDEFILTFSPNTSLTPGFHSAVMELTPIFSDRSEAVPVTFTCRSNIVPDIQVEPMNLVLVGTEDGSPEATIRVTSRSGKAISRCIAEEHLRTVSKGAIQLTCLGNKGENAFLYRVCANRSEAGIQATAIRFGLFVHGCSMPSETQVQVLFGSVCSPLNGIDKRGADERQENKQR